MVEIIGQDQVAQELRGSQPDAQTFRQHGDAAVQYGKQPLVLDETAYDVHHGFLADALVELADIAFVNPCRAFRVGRHVAPHPLQKVMTAPALYAGGRVLDKTRMQFPFDHPHDRVKGDTVLHGNALDGPFLSPFADGELPVAGNAERAVGDSPDELIDDLFPTAQKTAALRASLAPFATQDVVEGLLHVAPVYDLFDDVTNPFHVLNQ